MFGHHSSGFGRGRRAGALSGLAATTALGSTVFVGPLVWPVIQAPVWSALSDLYDYQSAQWLSFIIQIGTYPFTFFVIRAVLEAVFNAFKLFAIKRLV